MISTKQSLSPYQAALLADYVYRLKGRPIIEDNVKDIIKKNFYFNGSAIRLESKAGCFGFKRQSGFAFMSLGKKGSLFEGHAVLACRGTNDLYDVLTDINAGVRNIDGGMSIHSGFYRTATEFRAQVLNFIELHSNSIHKLHCVGHSLGGALATISAGSVSAAKKIDTELYTFGSPRVGDYNFANKLTQHGQLGKTNIHRVCHSGDPVAMVPMWPFVHTPVPDGECYIQRTWNFNPFDHKMGRYVESVREQNWQQLTKPQPKLVMPNKQDWQRAAQHHEGVGLTMERLRLIYRAFDYIDNATFEGSMNIVSGMVAGGATLLDRLSLMLHHYQEMPYGDKPFLKKVLLFIAKASGSVANLGSNISLSMIRSILVSLLFAMKQVIRSTIAVKNSVVGLAA